MEAESAKGPHEVCLTYVTARGLWYDVSWKGSEERSGGLVTNIGIHLFERSFVERLLSLKRDFIFRKL